MTGALSIDNYTKKKEKGNKDRKLFGQKTHHAVSSVTLV